MFADLCASKDSLLSKSQMAQIPSIEQSNLMGLICSNELLGSESNGYDAGCGHALHDAENDGWKNFPWICFH